MKGSIMKKINFPTYPTAYVSKKHLSAKDEKLLESLKGKRGVTCYPLTNF